MLLTDSESLSQAVCLSPLDVTAHMALVDCLQEQGDGEAALAACRRWVVACPESDDARWAMARVLVEVAGEKECPASRASRGALCPYYLGNPCPICKGSGTVSDGRREWAEFIACQMELAAIGDYDFTKRNAELGHKCYADKRRGELRERERGLLDAVKHHGEPEDVIPEGNFWVANVMGGLGFLSVNPELEIRHERGFPSRVRVPFAAWVGGEPCSRCEGRRWLPLPGESDCAPHKCPFCHGSGRTEGLGVRLCREWPVTSVEVTGKEPFWSGLAARDPSNSWWNADAFSSTWWNADAFSSNGNSDLPNSIYSLLEDGDPTDDGTGMHYPTREAALAALNAACLAHAREQAMRELFSLIF